jgi:hypothetical protein
VKPVEHLALDVDEKDARGPTPEPPTTPEHSAPVDMPILEPPQEKPTAAGAEETQVGAAATLQILMTSISRIEEKVDEVLRRVRGSARNRGGSRARKVAGHPRGQATGVSKRRGASRGQRPVGRRA